MIKILVIIGCAAMTMFAFRHLGRTLESRGWNNGHCRQCGERWVYFDADSQGGRGYKCGGCKACTWVSWGGIDDDR